MFHLLAYLPLMSIWSGCLKVCSLLALSRRPVSLSMVLTLSFRLEKYLITGSCTIIEKKFKLARFWLL